MIYKDFSVIQWVIISGSGYYRDTDHDGNISGDIDKDKLLYGEDCPNPEKKISSDAEEPFACAHDCRVKTGDDGDERKCQFIAWGYDAKNDDDGKFKECYRKDSDLCHSEKTTNINYKLYKVERQRK